MSKIDSILHTAVKHFPDAIAIDDNGEHLTYAELFHKVENSYNNLIVEPGTKVALTAGHSTEVIITILSLIYNRNLVALFSPDEPKDLLDKKLKQFQPDHLFDTIRTSSKIAISKPLVCLPDQLNIINPATLVFTSGSSGNPRGVIHTLGNHQYSALGSNENIKLTPGDRYLLSLPMHHISGLAILFRCFLSGATIVIDKTKSALADKIKKHKVTHLSIVPAQLSEILSDDDNKVNSLKAVLLGGSAVSPSLIQKAVDKKIPLCTTYGMSETSSQLTTTSLDDPPEKLLTSGKLLNYRKLKITDDGELLVAGDVLFHSYLSGEKNKTINDYFATGDIGSLDKNGYLTITGRKDNMFISGGENIHPEPLEASLCLLFEVEAVVVVPTTDQKFGWRAATFIKWKEDTQQLTLEELNKHLLKTFPPFCKIVNIFDWPKNIKSGLKLNRSDFSKLIK